MNGMMIAPGRVISLAESFNSVLPIIVKEPLIKSHMDAHSALRDVMQERRQREWLFPSLGA